MYLACAVDSVVVCEDEMDGGRKARMQELEAIRQEDIYVEAVVMPSRSMFVLASESAGLETIFGFLVVARLFRN